MRDIMCPDCNGDGELKEYDHNGIDVISVELCQRCNGTGKIQEDPICDTQPHYVKCYCPICDTWHNIKCSDIPPYPFSTCNPCDDCRDGKKTRKDFDKATGETKE